jgi:SH3-like domain-containing protein
MKTRLILAGLFLISVLCADMAFHAPTSAARARTQGSAGVAAVTRCDVLAYVNDRDPKGLNVRSGPGSTHALIGNLPNEGVEGIVVHINGSQGDWVRIDLAIEEGGDTERTFFKGEGWVYGPLLGVDGVGWIEGGTKLFQEPSQTSRILARMLAGGDGAKVRGCKGKWTYVEHKKVKGWCAPDTLCSNPLTTCS